MNSDLGKEVEEIPLKCWCITNGFIWQFWVVILDTIHFTGIIQVALLLWQGMERVEKANIPSWYFGYFKVLLTQLQCVLV